MPDTTGPGREPNEHRKFMREKIMKQPMTKGQLVKRGLAFFFLAVLFGGIASVSFVACRPWAEKLLGEEQVQESTPITIPMDEPESAPTSGTVESSEQVPETEPIEDMLQSAMEQYRFSVDDLNALYGDVRIIVQKADKGIVAVHSVKHQTDMFDNPVEKTGLYAGAVIASTTQEILVLTPEAAVEEADSIRVAFSDGSEYAGNIKQRDRVAGMAVVSVNTSDITPESMKNIESLVLGNSYAVKQGDLVIAVGSPAGAVHSTDYGFVSYISKGVQIADGMTRILYTGLGSNAEKGTFLINTSGQLIGWMIDDYDTESNNDFSLVRGISDYKAVLQKMSNGAPVPYLGVVGQEVTSAMISEGMPSGIYITNVVQDSPAYNAGIQNGDIIARIGEKEPATLKEFQSIIESLVPEQAMTILVLRNGRDEYKEIEYQVVIGAR